MSLTIRAMTPDDIEPCLTLTQVLKWPHRREEWQLALLLGEGTVIEEQGKLIGSAVRWRWGDSAATVGLVIIDNHQQGRGLGKQLMLAQLEKLPDVNVRLHATEMGKGLYEKLGFVSCGEIRQHQTREVTTLPEIVIPAGLHQRPATRIDHATMVMLDQQAHGMHRPALIDHLLRDCQTVLLQDGAQQTQGFASLRRFGHGWAIGPVIAANFPAAQALVASLMQSLQGEFLRIDTDAALPMAAWLESLGIPQVDAPTTMVRGTPWTPQGMQAFGLMTQAMA